MAARQTGVSHLLPEILPMTISMYHASAPRLANALTNLSALLTKAQAHVQAKKIDPAAIIDFRLYPDMLSFKRQIQIASDTCKGVMARLAGVDIPAYEDTGQIGRASCRERVSPVV
jgi:hypothetical protein